MRALCTTRLEDCLARYGSAVPALAPLGDRLQRLAGEGDPGALAEIYDHVYPLIEQALWSGRAAFDPLLDDYQGLFREQDALLRERETDDRHHFIISIPVADRPAHLRACLESIFQVCERFGYGGKSAGVHSHVKVVIAEDSREPASIRRHLDLVHEYGRKGLQVFHLGQEEQYALLQSVPAAQRVRLGNLLTTQARECFYRKGQAANRNLSYLKCLQLTEDRDRTLYYMIDCDQSLCVNRQTDRGEEVVYALNYFHYIDRVFRRTGTLMLTGKLVGDPPVSPSVMASNFLDDVIAFFGRLAGVAGERPCSFHGIPERLPGDAAYHDMAQLFGHESTSTPFPYPCRLAGTHDHAACLRDFAQRLSAFFFGEHLFRRTTFAYGGGFAALTPARTIYPGNYIVNYAGLRYVIPFGHLRLRMSGPTAGRLIAAEIGERFASFNMPNLHRRTTGTGLHDDFRPGVAPAETGIDLSDEFERQFFGDLMLFSTAELVARADVNQPFNRSEVAAVVAGKEADLLALYREKHEATQERIRRVRALAFGGDHWWTRAPALADALRQVAAFLGDMERNFGDDSPGWRQIQSALHREGRKAQIVDALANYRAERAAWDQLF
jgi:hypothetical protein